MENNDTSGERVSLFFALYEKEVQATLDAEEFAADDLYAFQALERALRSDNQELRNLAVHLQTQRQEKMESIVVDSTERGLRTTQRIKPLHFSQAPKELTDQLTEQMAIPAANDAMAAPEAANDAPPETAAEAGIDASGEQVTESTADSTPEVTPEAASEATPEAAPAAAPAQTERRAGAARLNAQELAQASRLQHLYRMAFDRPLDVARFTLDDEYGRAVIEESLGSDSGELVEVTRHYLDEQGQPRVHRRFSGQAPRS